MLKKSLRKKWGKAQYGRERYLAGKFLEALKERVIEKEALKAKIKKVVKEEIRRRLREKK